jgi:hypothetical protein
LPPDQSPEAKHEVAFRVDQAKDEDPPRSTVLGLACKPTSGPEEVTVTVVVCDDEPPGPVQVISYSVSFDRGPVDHVPLKSTPPCQPPLASHWVAFATLHLRTEAPRRLTVVGEAVRVIKGANRRVTVTLRANVEEPALLEQVRA